MEKDMDTLTMREADRRYGDRSIPRRLSIRATIQLIHILGLDACYIAAYSEFRVNLKTKHGGNVDTAYYTTDRQDALDTARVMARSICKPCTQGESRTEHDHDTITR